MYLLTFCEILLAIISILCVYIWYNFYKSSTNQYLKKFTGPKPHFLLGNALEIRDTTQLLEKFLEYTETNNGLAVIQIGPIRKFLLITNYKYIEFLLSSNQILNKSPEYKFISAWLGTGLLTSKATKWRKHRKIITPAFHFKILERFVDVFESTGDILCGKLAKEAGNTSVDIYPFITLCTLDIICESAMGASVNAQMNEDSEYVQSVKHMCRIQIERSVSIIEMYDFLYKFTKNYRIECKALKILHGYTNNVIDQRREELKNKTETSNVDTDSNLGIKAKHAFLDLLLQATVDGRPLTREEIREEVDTFMFEGHDTTASAISFTLYCLANNPDIQEKVMKEQEQIFGSEKNPSVTYANLQDMKYLELVIKETLRLYPSVPFYGRESHEGTVDHEGTTLPEGLNLLVFAYGIHHNPEYFPEPEKFIPTRFESMDGSLPYAYIPFSAGSRNCIGQKFALFEMKSVISKILRNFKLSSAIPQHKLVLAAETVLKSTNGINISIQHRNY